VYDRIVPHIPTNRYAKRPAFAYRLSSVTSCSTRTARADPASWTGSTGHSYQPGSRLSARDRALAERFGIDHSGHRSRRWPASAQRCSAHTR
jgi:hypothetical protein